MLIGRVKYLGTLTQRSKVGVGEGNASTSYKLFQHPCGEIMGRQKTKGPCGGVKGHIVFRATTAELLQRVL